MNNGLDVWLQYQFFPAFVALGAVAGVVFILWQEHKRP